MRRARILLVVTVVGAAAAACSSSSSNSSNNDAGSTTGDDSGGGSSSSSGGMVNPLGDSGLGMATFNCHSPADCTSGGAGQACCFDIMTMTANCQTGPCSMYTQCATSGDCPGGGTCTPSPLSASEHYCVGGGAEGGTTAEAGGHDGGTTEGGGTETGAPESGTPETGSSDAGGG